MAGQILKLPPKPAAPAETPEPQKRVRAKIVFAKELFSDIVTEIGPLARLHDQELWPNRQWGPLKLSVLAYLNMEKQNTLLVLTARTGAGRLIGYSMDVVLQGSLHYAATSHAMNDTIFLHPAYRVGKGLSLRKQPGIRFLLFRERQLDALKIERRRLDPKVDVYDAQGRIVERHDFGKILKRLFGYEEEAVVYARIVPGGEPQEE